MAKKRSRKKKYNPFTMWGAYVGAGIGLLGGIYLWFLLLFGAGMSGIDFSAQLFLYHTSVSFIPIILGFLIGWGIHALIRKIKK